jgi:hypothetical protein
MRSSPFASTRCAARFGSMKSLPGFTASSAAFCASYTRSYTSRCVLPNLPEMGSVRVMSAV